VLHDYPGSGTVPTVLTVYLGLLVVPLVLLALARGRGRLRWAWAAVAALGLVASLGETTPLYGWLHGVLPVFRFPSKFLLPAGLALVLLAARGTDLLPARLARFRWALVPVFLLDLFLAHGGLNPARPVAEVFPSVDRGDFLRVSDTRVWTDENELVPVTDATAVGDYVAAWRDHLRPNTHVLAGAGVGAVDGRTALELASQWTITETLRRAWPDRIRFLRVAGVSTVISRRDLGEVEGLRRTGDTRYEVAAFVPRAYAVGKVVELPPEAVGELEHGGFPLPRFDPTGAAWIRPGLLDAARYPDYGRFAVERERLDRATWRLRTAPDRPALVVVSESFHPGWSATVNGAAVGVLPVNNLFLGVEVPAGESTVELRFRPPGLVPGAGVSLAGLLLLVVGPLAGRLRGRG
jgi:hypothetical protein